MAIIIKPSPVNTGGSELALIPRIIITTAMIARRTKRMFFVSAAVLFIALPDKWVKTAHKLL
jgi:hypothetical protein